MITGCVRRQLSGLGLVLCGCFAGMVLVAGCNSAPPPVNTKAAEDAVRAADAAWSKAAGAMDVAAVASYYTDDATVLPPNMPIVSGQAEAQKAWAAILVPGNSVSWIANKVVSAASGDLVYDQGTYTSSMKGPGGKMVADLGKYLCVWKQQPDGHWKAVEDMWSSDLPAVAAKPGKAAKAAKAAKKKKG